jgi:hypothetical protein
LNREIALLSALGIAVVLLLAVLGFSDSVVAASREGRARNNADYRSSASTQSFPTSPLTYYIYLPSVSRDIPPITQTLKSKYLFVERWVIVESNEYCDSNATSLPVYSFDPYNGILIIYPANPELKLQASDVGYIGWGTAGGGYYANNLARFDDIPFSAGGLTLTSIYANGTVSLEYASESITLESGSKWISSTVSQPSGSGACMITITQRITNYAFQNRDKITYYNP